MFDDYTQSSMEQQINFNGRQLVVDKLPDECPFCHQGIQPALGQGHSIAGNLGRVILHCTRHGCQEVFIAYYHPSNTRSGYLQFHHTSIGRNTHKSFHKSIGDISPDFVLLFNQAFSAEQYGLSDICGTGYRKALEFLIKDYVKKHHPGKEPEIKSKQIQNVVSTFIDDKKIKEVAKRAIWLGNDETHYERKWENQDLNSLKNLIDLVCAMIQQEYDYDEILKTMPEGR